jgi:bifunctional non-homologous end joining protein LigD
MLAKDADAPFSNENWLFEIKWDGYRAIAEVDSSDVKLYSRNGNSFVSNYPVVVEALSQKNIQAVMDGEIVVINEDGKPDFQKLQHYDGNRHLPLLYYVFDLLELNGKKLHDLPLTDRKYLLQGLLEENPVVKYSDHIEESGEDFYEVIKDRDLEGIMAKRKDSKYFPGKRSPDWLKIKLRKSDEAIIGGFTAPRGGRKHFGALVLGTYINGKLTYIGHTGSGFDTTLLKEIYATLQPLIIDSSPFVEKVKTNMPVTWVQPKYVCEVQFSEWTSDGKLRHPIFLRMREDKKPEDVNFDMNKSNKTENLVGLDTEASELKQKGAGKAVAEKKPLKKAAVKKAKETGKKASSKTELKPEKEPSAKAAHKKEDLKAKHADSVTEPKNNKDVVDNEKEKIYKIGKVQLKTTNRTKIFFPDEGITKGDVIDYYERMADVIIPHIKDRPESLFRTPNGINQKGFFQKDAGDEAPSWVQHIELFSESTSKDIDYILCNNKPTLIYLANLGCIEINPWHSRVKTLDNPDYLIIDIDPSDNNTFNHVIEAATVVKGVLDQAGAFSICKTSGASGLHVYVPLGAEYDYDQARDFAYLICMMANQLLPEITTLERNLSKRSKDKIYMDYLQNRKGQTIACVYSMRPKKGATVSTPLEWNEVKSGLSPRDFNIYTIGQRLKEKGDLFAPMLNLKNAIDLGKCLENLGG